MAKGLARGTHMGLCRELPLTIEGDCLQLQLLGVALPEVLSSLPKLAHVQHRHLAWLEEDLAAVKEECRTPERCKEGKDSESVHGESARCWAAYQEHQAHQKSF